MTNEEKKDFVYVTTKLLETMVGSAHMIGIDNEAYTKLQDIIVRHNLSEAKSPEQKLIEILDNFYYNNEVGHCMYFTEGESAILAKYLIENGVYVYEEKTNSERD